MASPAPKTHSVSARTLDFVIIGAQKAGTTSLHMYLKTHPRIFMPAEKETAFFSRDDWFALGLDWYLQEWFGDAPQDVLLGEASPQYMADPQAPARIHGNVPGAKLIALLRNPIERAYSHYRMTVRRGLEKRSFAEAATELTDREGADTARSLRATREAESSCYFAWGEYGRILSVYRQFYPRTQLLALATEDLESNPQKVIDACLAHLDLSPGFVPENLERRYHQGGEQQRFPRLRSILRHSPLLWLWRMLPLRHRRAVDYWYEQFNIVARPPGASEITPAVREKLAAFYADDVRRLTELAGRTFPWPEFFT